MARPPSPERKIAVQNRKARFDYEILETYDAGIQLVGSEVKSLRLGHGSLSDAYAQDYQEEVFLYGLSIPKYAQAGKFNHDPDRPKKLLLKKQEIARVMGRIQTKGLTLIPLCVYFNPKGFAKVELALAKGKTKYDKRETEKNREWAREKSRLLKE